MAENIVQNQKKDKKLVYVAIIVAVLVVLIATVIIALGGNGRKIRKAEDAAKKYLLDLDFDNAILMYDEILKLDPTNVDAYIGLADIYVAKEEYQSAIDVLNQALNVITDEKDISTITNKIDEVNQIIGGSAELNNGEIFEEAIGQFLLLGNSDYVEENGFRYGGFYEYEYPSEVATMLDTFISLATSGRYSEASDYAINTLRPELSKYGWVQGIILYGDSNECASVRLIRNGYKVCAFFRPNGDGCYYMITPVEAGTGFGYNSGLNSDHVDHVNYDTVNGRPNGHFHLVEEHSNGRVVEYDGYTVDGLLDGTVVKTDSQFDFNYACYFYYANGFLSKYEKNDEYEFGYYTGFDADGNSLMESNYSSADYSPLTEFKYLSESMIGQSYTIYEAVTELSY